MRGVAGRVARASLDTVIEKRGIGRFSPECVEVGPVRNPRKDLHSQPYGAAAQDARLRPRRQHMNDTTDLAHAAAAVDASERVRRLFAAQRAAFASQPCPDAGQRRDWLTTLKRQIQRYQDVLAAAMSKDFGYRSEAESKMLDLLGSVL